MSAWDFFPLVLCINLRERDDRLAEAKQEFAHVGISNVMFYRSWRHRKRDKAIIDAHMACLRYAVNENVPYVLIFEDDVEFCFNYKEHLLRAIDFLSVNPEWNILHLGGLVVNQTERVLPHIVRGDIITSHA